MTRKTEEVYELVHEVLGTMSEPYSEDITDEVCIAIEKESSWYLQYQQLCAQLTRDVVNNHIGYYTKIITGKISGRQVTARKSNLIKSYTKLI